ncbi:AfsR/SARP family transcriptional regulator [Paractinoplanes toevensis]|uniref:OmpR/PhoB-type domain-containing protein n=1 Tax=Paractinoplanes toevensis TaxID=571911 RepID=A0A919W1Y1_9ACTN|nr:BTAD domain-containing putative transcriptional regulator [Actinoplanes toevensis]GIM92972.1 hypothetical protein Ato02nite_047650 [Actinoplanes toevensis]
MPTPVRLLVFGGLRLWRSGVEIDVGPLRRQIVFAVLLAARGAVVSVADLVDVLWGDDPSASATNQVHRLIGEIRRMFEPSLGKREVGAWVHPHGNGYRLVADARTCDLTAFFDLETAARAAVRRDDSQEATHKFEQALRTARDQPFAGLPPHVLQSPSFVAIDATRNDVAVAAADLALGHPRARQLLPLINRYAAASVLHEPLQARRIRLLNVTGHRAEALMHYDQVRQRLADELGADPSVELQAAHLTALAQPDEPREVRPAQLPLGLAALAPHDDVQAALRAERGSLVVLTGMGGIGKTALAVDWAHRIAADYPDGQMFLNLRGFDAEGSHLRPFEALGILLTTARGLRGQGAGYGRGGIG